MNEKNNIAPINEELNVVNNETENIKNLIYNIRGKQVMLDSDGAILYHYPTKRINETVNRNKKRFPEVFCFQLTELDIENMRSQIATASKNFENKFRNKKYLPYAFTEQGIAMLSGLLKNDIAIQVSINIMNAFVEMRKFILLNGEVFQEINTIKGKLLEYDKKFDVVFNELQNNKEKEFKQKYFLMGKFMMHIV